MDGAPMNAPQIKLMELRQYKSERTGATYFAGFLGNARVVMLRDERAERAGKEVARWNVLLEEQAPRESRPAADTRRQDARRSETSDRHPRRPNGRQERAERRQATQQAFRETVADRSAGSVMSEMGVDPQAPMRDDDVPF
ncbi:hypothetical protein CTI14_00390 [Methylobacterium radiotolerans]|nr:hypothetical protein CTI14_00390 [Methylobacterium radiotolerans]